jgi:hypothetical protein
MVSVMSKRDGYKKEWRWRKQGFSDATIEDYEALAARQGGNCFICGAPPKRKALVFDPRGLLCTACHVKMAWLQGHFEEILTFFGDSLPDDSD